MTDEPGQWPSLTATLFNKPSSTTPSTTPHLTAATLSAFITAIQSLQPDPTTPLPHKAHYLDNPTHAHIASITFAPAIPLPTLRNNPALTTYEQTHSVQLTLQPTATQQTRKKLAVFDMDSTLIQQEVIDLLASVAGVEPQVSSITARAMNGELDFGASLRERVALLAGLPEDVFESLKPRVTLTPGADVLLRVLQARGVRTALLSGGFTPLARWVAGRLGIDHVHANELEVEAGVLTGKLARGSVVVDSARKEVLLRAIAEEEGVVAVEEVLAVGDGANDLPMLWAAGLGVAVNAKPRVQLEAPVRLNGDTALLDVLYLLGMTGDEIDRLAGDR